MRNVSALSVPQLHIVLGAFGMWERSGVRHSCQKVCYSLVLVMDMPQQAILDGLQDMRLEG